jgi:hypothetical protein
LGIKLGLLCLSHLVRMVIKLFPPHFDIFSLEFICHHIWTLTRSLLINFIRGHIFNRGHILIVLLFKLNKTLFLLSRIFFSRLFL